MLSNCYDVVDSSTIIDANGYKGPGSYLKEYNYYVVEDAAQSLGATYKVGEMEYQSASCVHADVAVLSFHALKHVTTGEGGAIVTRDGELAAKVALLRTHGIRRGVKVEGLGGWGYEQIDLGYHYRLTEMQAALGITQLKRLPEFLESRRAAAARYREAFSQEPFKSAIRVSPQSLGHAYHLFVIHFKDSTQRDEAYEFLKAKGVLTQVHHRPIYQFPYYKERFGEMFLEGAEAYTRGCLSIPMFSYLKEY